MPYSATIKEKGVVYIMKELLDWLDYIEDVRQARKVRHKLKDILVIVLFATLDFSICIGNSRSFLTEMKGKH